MDVVAVVGAREAAVITRSVGIPAVNELDGTANVKLRVASRLGVPQPDPLRDTSAPGDEHGLDAPGRGSACGTARAVRRLAASCSAWEAPADVRVRPASLLLSGRKR
jgi:hypothetical protein